MPPFYAVVGRHVRKVPHGVPGLAILVALGVATVVPTLILILALVRTLIAPLLLRVVSRFGRLANRRSSARMIGLAHGESALLHLLGSRALPSTPIPT
jgi:hypothetical protein